MFYRQNPRSSLQHNNRRHFRSLQEISSRYNSAYLVHLHSVLQRNSSTFLTRNSGAHPPGVPTRGNSIRRWNSLSNDELLGEDSGRFQHLAAATNGSGVYNNNPSDKNLVIIPNHYQNNTPTARLLNSSFSSCELFVFVQKKYTILDPSVFHFFP